jgi:hypothetical protein
LNRGALLSLPNGGHRKDVIRRKAFEDYIRSHVVSWFTWTQNNQLGVERMEDLILVTGCTLVTSWAAAVFVEDNMETEVSLASRILSNVGASFVWSKIRGPAVYHNSHFDPVCSLGYLYSPCTDFFLCCIKSKIHSQPRISASLSRASEQSVLSSGLDTSVLQQNPFLTTLTTTEMMRYRSQVFPMFRK